MNTAAARAAAEERRLSRLRNKARRQGYKVWKVRPTSRSFNECGPYALIDFSNNTLAAHGIADLDQLEIVLTED